MTRNDPSADLQALLKKAFAGERPALSEAGQAAASLSKEAFAEFMSRRVAWANGEDGPEGTFRSATLPGMHEALEILLERHMEVRGPVIREAKGVVTLYLFSRKEREALEKLTGRTMAELAAPSTKQRE